MIKTKRMLDNITQIVNTTIKLVMMQVKKRYLELKSIKAWVLKVGEVSNRYQLLP